MVPRWLIWRLRLARLLLPTPWRPEYLFHPLVFSSFAIFSRGPSLTRLPLPAVLFWSRNGSLDLLLVLRVAI